MWGILWKEENTLPKWCDLTQQTCCIWRLWNPWKTTPPGITWSHSTLMMLQRQHWWQQHLPCPMGTSSNRVMPWYLALTKKRMLNIKAALAIMDGDNDSKGCRRFRIILNTFWATKIACVILLDRQFNKETKLLILLTWTNWMISWRRSYVSWTWPWRLVKISN